MTPEEFGQRLDSNPIVLDGGLATSLENAGADISGSLWSARVLRDSPEEIRAAHGRFIEAGADVIITASYQVSRRGVIEVGGSAAQADELLIRSIEIARESVGAAGLATLVAASVGPYGATNHDGSEYRGRYGVSQKTLIDFHRERLEVLLAANPDLLAIETIPDLDEVLALIEVLADHRDVAAWVSLTTLDGATTCAGQALAEVAAALGEAPSVVAVGVNCSAPSVVSTALQALGKHGSRLLAYPNAGQTWHSETETWSGPAEPVLPTQLINEWLDLGARAVGGCCGVDSIGVSALAGDVAGWHSD